MTRRSRISQRPAVPNALLTKDVEHTALVNWILSNSENQYLPFGKSNHGAKSIYEYRARCESFTKQKIERWHPERMRQEEARTRKANEVSPRLFGALRRKDRRAVAALLIRGADPNAKDEQGRTAIEYAISLGIEKWLDQSGS